MCFANLMTGNYRPIYWTILSRWQIKYNFVNELLLSNERNSCEMTTSVHRKNVWQIGHSVFVWIMKSLQSNVSFVNIPLSIILISINAFQITKQENGRFFIYKAILKCVEKIKYHIVRQSSRRIILRSLSLIVSLLDLFMHWEYWRLQNMNKQTYQMNKISHFMQTVNHKAPKYFDTSKDCWSIEIRSIFRHSKNLNLANETIALNDVYACDVFYSSFLY